MRARIIDTALFALALCVIAIAAAVAWTEAGALFGVALAIVGTYVAVRGFSLPR